MGSDRSGILGAFVLAAVVSAVPAAAQSPAVPSPTPLPDDAVVLAGTIVGSNAGPYGRQVETDYATQATMDITLTLMPDREIAQGSAQVSGEYSGDCQWADAEVVPIAWDSNPDGTPPPFTPSTGRPGFASVQAYTTDPRFAERPLEGFYLSVAAGTGGEGGTCGYLTGRTYPITDVDFPLRVEVMGCMTLDVVNLGDAWSGSCAETDASTGQVHIDWTANLEQTWP